MNECGQHENSAYAKAGLAHPAPSESPGGLRNRQPGPDASPVLEPAEHALDEVSLFVGMRIEGLGPLSDGLLAMTGVVPRSFRNRRSLSASWAVSARHRRALSRVSGRIQSVFEASDEAW
jgi:hypothetical protein